MKRHLMTAAMLALAISMTATSCHKDDDDNPADKTETSVAEKVTITLPDGSTKEVEKDSKYTVSAQSTTDDGLIVKYYLNGKDVSGQEITVTANSEIIRKEFATVTLPGGATTEVEKDSKYAVSAQTTTDEGLIVKYYLNGEEVSGKEITMAGNIEITSKEFATVILSDGSKEELEKGAEYTLPVSEKDNIVYKSGNEELAPGTKLTVDKNLDIKIFHILSFAEFQTADFSDQDEVFLKITDVTNDNVGKIRDYLSTKTNLILAGSVTSVEEYLFLNCESLQSVVIPNSVKSIGESAFGSCKSLQSIEIPNSVISIGGEAFYLCSSLQSIVIPNSVESIGEGTFANCESLQSVVIPNSVESIGEGAFNLCKSLKSIVIPNSVTSIGDEAFSRCESLQSIEIGNSVKSIGEAAFVHCTSLQSIEIPNSVESIGKETFQNCQSLKSVVISNSVTSIEGYTFYLCNSLESVSIPNSVKSIASGAFWGCEKMKSIELPNSLTSIAADAFVECLSLESITIPNSVESIGDESFWGCESLQTIIIKNSEGNITMGSDVFEGCPGKPVFQP